MTIQVTPEQERLIAQAIQAGLIERADEAIDVGLEVLRSRLGARVASTSPMSSEEWMRKFRDWAQSHSTTTPLLSDEAISRESIYRECGL